MNNYSTIEKALIYIAENFKQQPSLKDIANHVGLSEFHFQKKFTEWAGISPKKFLKYANINHAKQVLSEGGSIVDATYRTGLSGTSRLHDLFVNILAMTPAEYNNGGKNLVIKYSFNTSRFGEYLIASTPKGICEIIFASKNNSLEELTTRWPNAIFKSSRDINHRLVSKFIENKLTREEKITVHIKGTNFQIKVWEALLKIPTGNLTSYGQLATHLNCKSNQAVGTAIGSNHIAYLIPCHRVINVTGVIGEYRWGKEKKLAMLGYELCSRN